ncbi:alpha/beta hydrolase family protein [Microbulbifer sp.]|uniref:alpha/beta hydrolase family protein n=1 Tax=Microbulbifer sp. TaxID=1908541 RepID=UPI002F91FE33
MRLATQFLARLILLIPTALILPSYAAPLPLDDLIRPPEVHQVKLSPNGSHIAVLRMHEGERVLVFMSISPLKVTGSLRLRGKEEVGGFFWANDERVIVSTINSQVAADAPVNYGSWFAVNADGSKGENILAFSGGMQLGTRIKRRAGYVHAEIIDPLVDNEKEILISTYTWARDRASRGDVYRVNIYTGVRQSISDLPVPGGRAYTDERGELIFANGTNRNNDYELYTKTDRGWEQVTHPILRNATPVGYDHDRKLSYLVLNTPDQTQTLISWDSKNQKLEKIIQNDIVDISSVIKHPRTSKPIGVHLNPDYPTVEFFDEGDGFAPLYRGMKKAFEGSNIHFTSFSRDGKKGLLEVSGDRMPGDFFLVDLETKKVDFLLSSADWLQPDDLNPMHAGHFVSSDGLRISTYLTFPKGTEKTGKLPMVVIPHSAPQARDFWGYSTEAQILSQNGYLVLQVNFRGSTGYGDRFYDAGKNQWGDNVQRDIAEGVQWAIDQGYADADRVCIYGASFGGYSALMNPIRNPDLYKCAAVYGGVYDLELLYPGGHVHHGGQGTNYLSPSIDLDKEEMRANSPLQLYDQLDLPMFIIHGREDESAPVVHAETILGELKKNGKPAQSLILDHEGHVFHNIENRRLLYAQLLDYLDTHIGAGAAKSEPTTLNH